MASYEPSDAEWQVYGTMFAASRFGSRILATALWGEQSSAMLRMKADHRHEPRLSHRRPVCHCCPEHFDLLGDPKTTTERPSSFRFLQ
jgi:hypothetical protein